MSDADWIPYGTAPVTVSRNLTISGAYEEAERWPTLDMSYVKGKVRLRGGASVSLNITHVVMVNFREAPLFQAPGLDLAAATPTNPTVLLANITASALVSRGSPVPLATIWLHTMAVVQDTCLPPSKYRQSSSQNPRPPEVPGPQLADRTAPFTDCSNATAGVSPMRQCWVAQGMYYDMASYAFDVDPYNKQAPGDYILRVFNTAYLCERVMDEECAERLGVVGCYLSMFPKTNRTGGSPPASSKQPAPANSNGTDPAAPMLTESEGGSSEGGGSQVAGGGGSGGGGISTGARVGICVGAVGGAVALALLMVVTFRRRRRPVCDGQRAPEVYLEARSTSNVDGHVEGGSLTSGKAGYDPAAKFTGEATCSSAHASSDVPGHNSLNESLHNRHQDQAQRGLVVGPAADMNLIPVTSLTPLLPGVNLHLKMHTDVQLTSVVLGAGTFGSVVLGVYGGEKVAVKLVKMGLAGVQFVHAAPSQLEGRGQPAAVEPGGGGEGGGEGEGRGVEGGGAQQSAGADPAGSSGPRRQDDAGDGGGVEEETPGDVRSGPEPGLAGKEGRGDSSPGKIGEAGRLVPPHCCSAGSQPVEVEPGTAVAAAAKDPGSAALAGRRTMGANRALLQEVEVLARCEHPNVVRLLAASTEPPCLCLVMELMDTSLERMLYGKGEEGEGMPLTKVLHIAIQISMALSYLHPTILHRDLKPANVLIRNPDCDTPLAKLGDFGLSRLRETVLVTRNPEVGTAPYMAPETFDLENVTVTDRADIYSLGVILYELLSARRPWPCLNMVQIAYNVAVQQLRPPLELLPYTRCPAKMRSLISSCWEPDPGRRPAAAEVVKNLMLMQQELKKESGTFPQATASAPHPQPAAAPGAAVTAAAPAAHQGVQIVVLDSAGLGFLPLPQFLPPLPPQ